MVKRVFLPALSVILISLALLQSCDENVAETYAMTCVINNSVYYNYKLNLEHGLVITEDSQITPGNTTYKIIASQEELTRFSLPDTTIDYYYIYFEIDVDPDSKQMTFDFNHDDIAAFLVAPRCAYRIFDKVKFGLVEFTNLSPENCSATFYLRAESDQSEIALDYSNGWFDIKN